MIGKLKKVSLREIWKDEAKDFTSWLSENIDALNEALELDLSVVEKEKSVGPFSSDIVAEDDQGTVVIVENQLEKTNHDHLGKIVTYLSNLDNAKMAIWISSNPVEEHRKAIEWLNEFTPEDVSFYLIKVEAVRIGESAPAPLFTVVAEPTELAKELGKEKKEYAERHHLRKEFWASLLDRAKNKTNLLSNLSPTIHHWIGTGAGRSGLSYNLVITKTYGSIELYLDRGRDFPTLNKERFDQLYRNKDKIEKIFGGKLNWERLDKRRASRISKRFEGSTLTDKEKWPEAQDKMIDGIIRLEKAFKPYIKDLKSERTK